MKLTGKRVLVTGAGGFMGSHLAERLVREGCQVTALVHYDTRANHSNLEFVEPPVKKEMNIQAGDVRDPFFMNRLIKNCDVVFHLAALIGIPYSYVAPASYVETNIQGTLNVLEAGLAYHVERVIQTSTSECYGTARYTPIDERHPLHGQSPYAATKIGADKLAESFHLSFDLRVTTVRPFNTFGPRQSARAVVPTVLSQLLSGATELQLGALDPVRDLNYVTNTVDGFVALAGSEEAIGQVVNVGGGTGVTIEQLARLAMKVVGREVPIRCDEQRARPPNSEVRTLLCDHTLVTQLTGWQPEVDLARGLQHTASFIEQYRDLYRPEAYAL